MALSIQEILFSRIPFTKLCLWPKLVPTVLFIQPPKQVSLLVPVNAALVWFAGFQELGDRAIEWQWLTVQDRSHPIQHGPSRLIRHVEPALQVANGEPAIRRTNQIDCFEPLLEWYMAASEDRSDSDRELLATTIALIAARPAVRAGAFPSFERSGFACLRAMRTDGTVWPELRFHVSAGRFRVDEMSGGHAHAGPNSFA